MRVLATALLALAAAAAGVAIAHSGGGSRHEGGHASDTAAAARRGSTHDAVCPSVTSPKLKTTTAPPPAALVAALPVLSRPRRAGDAPPVVARTALALQRAVGVNLIAARRIGGDDAWLVPVRDVGGRGCQRHRARPGAFVVGASELYPLVGANTRELGLGAATLVQPCAGSDGELVHVGALFRGHVAEASLLDPDGSSVQAAVTDGYAEFLLPERHASLHRSRTLQWTDDAGVTRRQRVDLPGFAVHCPPAPLSVGRPVNGPGRIELRVRPLLGEGPNLTARLAMQDQLTCVRVGPTYDEPCTDRAALHNQDGIGGWGARLRDGTLVVAGLVDPSTIRAVRVRRVGWPSGMRITVPVSRSGAFVLAERGGFPDAVAWQLRTILRSGRPGALRSVGLHSSIGGGIASTVAEQLVAHYAVLRRPRTAADELAVRPRNLNLRSLRQTDANPAFSRRIGGGGRARFWLVPGERSLCVVEIDDDGGSNAGCSSTDQAGLYNGHQPMGFSSFVPVGPNGGPQHRFRVFVLLPDGSRDARLVRGGRVVRRLAIHANGIVLLTRHGGRISWRAPDGSRHSMRIL